MARTKIPARRTTGIWKPPRKKVLPGSIEAPTKLGRDDMEVDPANLPAIREKMQTILEHDKSFGVGGFSFRQTRADAPNPVIVVDGLGVIGLPLNPREAEVLKARASQAPGVADSTGNTSVRNAWEMDSKEVTIGNQTVWDTFMAETVRNVCRVLGVNQRASKPRCSFSNMVLYEPGSRSLPYVIAEKQDGVFATIMVILPSESTGGAVYVSHSGEAKIYDCSFTSATNTTVLAWYTEVTHEVRPVTSGFRLVLSYNLVHTTTALRPGLTPDTDRIATLRTILAAWKEYPHRPEKLVCFLAHKYPESNLCGSALRGPDAAKLAVLDSLAKECGFGLALATVVYWECGHPVDDGIDYEGLSTDAYDVDSMKMEESPDTRMTLENIVNVEGKVILDTYHVDDERECIPDDTSEIARRNGYYKQEFEDRDEEDGGPLLKRWYRSNALVIWPVHGSAVAKHKVAVDHAGPSRLLDERQEKRRKTAGDQVDLREVPKPLFVPITQPATSNEASLPAHIVPPPPLVLPNTNLAQVNPPFKRGTALKWADANFSQEEVRSMHQIYYFPPLAAQNIPAEGPVPNVPLEAMRGKKRARPDDFL